MNKSPWWYEAKYEEMQSKGNAYLSIALMSILINFLLLVTLGVVLFG